MNPTSQCDFIEYELNEKKKLSLLGMYQDNDKVSKKSLIAIAVTLDNILITKNFLQSVIFKEELNLFDNIDSTANQYFQNTYRKVDNINSKTLLLTFKDKKYYFSRVEAKAIIYIWNMIINYYSCEELPRNFEFFELYQERFPYGR